MIEVIKSLDNMARHLDEVLSSGRLKPSERRKLKEMRRELVETRELAAKHRRKGPGVWVLQLVSLVVRVADLLDRHQ
jgi:hypothetical protein